MTEPLSSNPLTYLERWHRGGAASLLLPEAQAEIERLTAELETLRLDKDVQLHRDIHAESGEEIRFLRAERDRLRAAFKNFHRLLCERFGYGHDEVDWERDQLSLIEWIAKRGADETTKSPKHAPDCDLRVYGNDPGGGIECTCNAENGDGCR